MTYQPMNDAHCLILDKQSNKTDNYEAVLDSLKDFIALELTSLQLKNLPNYNKINENLNTDGVEQQKHAKQKTVSISLRVHLHR